MASRLKVPILGNTSMSIRNEWRLDWNTNDLIPDADLFKPADPDFGRVADPTIFVANNLSTDSADDIAGLFGEHHKSFNILLTSPAFAVVRDTSNAVLYEVIYFRIIDFEENSDFDTSGKTAVSANFSHLREEILLTISNTDELPEWMTTEQVLGDTTSVLGYTPAAVVAYVLPTKGSTNVASMNTVTTTITTIQPSPTTFDTSTTIFDESTSTFDDTVTFITSITKGPGLDFVGRPYTVGQYIFENDSAETQYLKFESDSPNPIWLTPPGSLGSYQDEISITPAIQLSIESPLNLTVTYKIIFGSLPSGLSLDVSTGIISGVPTAILVNTVSEFTIRVTDQNSNTSDRRFDITINA